MTLTEYELNARRYEGSIPLDLSKPRESWTDLLRRKELERMIDTRVYAQACIEGWDDDQDRIDAMRAEVRQKCIELDPECRRLLSPPDDEPSTP